MQASLILKDRIVHEDGYIQEMVIWKVSEPVKGSKHTYKYRLFFGLPGMRIVGYDNERLKGDHRHYEDREESYAFSGVKELVEDFLADIQHHMRQYRGRNSEKNT